MTPASPFCVLLLSPRAPVTLEWARLLLRSGVVVHVADALRLHPLRFSRAVTSHRITAPRTDVDAFHSDIRAIVEAEGINLIIPTCEEVFWAARGAATLGAPLFSPDAPLLTALHDKMALQDRLRDLGAPYSITVDAREGDLDEAPRSVFKKRYSRFANAVHIAPPRALIEQVLDEDPSVDTWLMQERATGREVCTYSIAWRGEVMAHATYDAPFRAGPGASISFRSVSAPTAEAVVRRLVADTGFTGQIAFDFIIDAPPGRGGIGPAYALECNPRATSGLHLFAERDDLVAALLARWRAAASDDDAEAPVATSDGRDRTLRPAPDTDAMLLGPMLLYGWQAWRQRSGLRAFFSTLARARDVMFRWTLPLPFVVQMLTGMTLLARALRHRCSILEASTVDIEYNEIDVGHAALRASMDKAA